MARVGVPVPVSGGGCGVSLVRGSPATLLVSCDGEYYVVDPGHGRKRAKQLAKALGGAGRVVFLVTHFHSDHLNALAEGLLDALGGSGARVEVAAPRGDAAGVRDPLVRVALTFGLPLAGDAGFLPYKPLPVPVDVEVEAPGRLGPLELVPLPGHTPGQVGALAPDGTLYAADALFGPRVLERYRLPYHLDPCRALETLEGLHGLLGRVDAVQPAHGPRVPAGEAGGLVEANAGAVRRLLDLTREALGEPLTASEAAARVAGRAGAPGEPGLLLLIEATVRGAIACLSARGEVEPAPQGGAVAWRLARR